MRHRSRSLGSRVGGDGRIEVVSNFVEPVSSARAV
jgi:hypothetical protein